MAAMSQPLVTTDRTKVRRLPDRGTDDRTTAYAVIDEAYIAHVGFVVDGEPRVLPMTYGRDGDVLYLHGAVGNAMLRASAGREVCVTITLLDGLVLARSAFHHSMNYRSVVLLGEARKVEDEEEKRHAFDVIVEHVLDRAQPGRPAGQRVGAAQDARARAADRGGLGQGAHRWPDRRRRGHGPAGVGRRRAAAPRPRRPVQDPAQAAGLPVPVVQGAGREP